MSTTRKATLGAALSYWSPSPASARRPSSGSARPGHFAGSVPLGARSGGAGSRRRTTAPWGQGNGPSPSPRDGSGSTTSSGRTSMDVNDWTKLGGPGEVALGWWEVANVFADPCHWKDSLADPPVGPTVDDLATAFVAQVGRDGSGPTDVILGGYPAKRVELSVPADLDVATCDEGVYREFLSPGESLTSLRASADPAEPIGGRIDVLYILDVDGTRWLMRTWHHPDDLRGGPGGAGGDARVHRHRAAGTKPCRLAGRARLHVTYRESP